MESIVGLTWAYSNKRQSAYATPNPQGDIDQSHPFEGADFGEHTPNMSDNAAFLGKGHEFATRNEIISWDTRFRRSFTATTKILGWAFAFHMGKDTPTNPGGSAYQHAFEYMDPITGAGYYGSPRQQPVTTIIERVTSGLVRRFPSCVVSAVEVTGALNDWAKVAVELIGSGFKDTVASGYSFPASTEGALLRFSSLTFTHPSGVDISCDARSFRFRSEYQYDETGGYCPGSGYLTPGDPTSGAVRNKLEFTRRAVLLEFVVTASSTNHTYFTRLEANTDVYTKLVLEGALITGVIYHTLTIEIPHMKYRAIPIAADGDIITYAVQGVIFYDVEFANPLKVTVINDTAAYLASS